MPLNKETKLNHIRYQIVSLSSRVENLKVKKVMQVSYLNKESRQCFAYFGIPIAMNVLQIRIFT